jgi:hypothetical protein
LERGEGVNICLKKFPLKITTTTTKVDYLSN